MGPGPLGGASAPHRPGPPIAPEPPPPDPAPATAPIESGFAGNRAYTPAMLDQNAIRRLALALPGAAEQPHHGFPSFRVASKIFATLPKNGRLNVMLDADDVDTAIHTPAAACEELHWGKRLCGVSVDLSRAHPEAVQTLLTQAWRLRARPEERNELDEDGP